MRLNIINMNKNKSAAFKATKLALMFVLFCLVVCSVCFTNINSDFSNDNLLNVAEAASGGSGTISSSNYYDLENSSTIYYSSNGIKYDFGAINKNSIYYSYYTEADTVFSSYGSSDLNSNNYKNILTQASDNGYRYWYNKASDFSDSTVVTNAMTSLNSGKACYAIADSKKEQKIGNHNLWNSILNIKVPEYLSNYKGTYTLTLSGKMLLIKESTAARPGFFFAGYKTSSSFISATSSTSASNNYSYGGVDQNSNIGKLVGDSSFVQLKFNDSQSSDTNGYFTSRVSNDLNVSSAGSSNNYNVRVNTYYPVFLNFSVDIAISNPSDVKYLALALAGYAVTYTSAYAEPRGSFYDLSISATNFTNASLPLLKNDISCDYAIVSPNNLTSSWSTESVTYNYNPSTTTVLYSATNPTLSVGIFDLVVIIPNDVYSSGARHSRSNLRFSEVKLGSFSSTLGYDSTNDNGIRNALVISSLTSTRWKSMTGSNGADKTFLNKYALSTGTPGTSDQNKAYFYYNSGFNNIVIISTNRTYKIHFLANGGTDLSGKLNPSANEVTETANIEFTMAEVSSYYKKSGNVGVGWTWNGYVYFGTSDTAGVDTNSGNSVSYICGNKYVNISTDLNTNVGIVKLNASWSNVGVSVANDESITMITYAHYENGGFVSGIKGKYDDLRIEIRNDDPYRELVGVRAVYSADSDIGAKAIALEKYGTNGNNTYWMLYGICGSCLLYADWKASQYSITYKVGDYIITPGGTVSNWTLPANAPSTVYYGEKVYFNTIVPTTDQNTYTFLGWANSSTSTSWYKDKTITGNITAYLRYNQDANIVTHTDVNSWTKAYISKTVNSSDSYKYFNNATWAGQTGYGYGFEYNTSGESRVSCAYIDAPLNLGNISNYKEKKTVYLYVSYRLYGRTRFDTASESNTEIAYIGISSTSVTIWDDIDGQVDYYSQINQSKTNPTVNTPTLSVTQTFSSSTTSFRIWTGGLTKLGNTTGHQYAFVFITGISYSIQLENGTTYSVTLDPNNIATGATLTSQTLNCYKPNSTYSLPSSIYDTTNSGYRFVGWSPVPVDPVGEATRSSMGSFSAETLTSWNGMTNDSSWDSFDNYTTLKNNVGKYYYVRYKLTNNNKIVRYVIKITGVIDNKKKVITDNIGWYYEDQALILSPGDSYNWIYSNFTFYARWEKKNYPLIIYDCFTDGEKNQDVATTIKKEWYVEYGSSINYNQAAASTNTAYSGTNIYPYAGSLVGSSPSDIASEYNGFSNTGAVTVFQRTDSSPINNNKSSTEWTATYDDVSNGISNPSTAGARWMCYVWTLSSITVSLKDYDTKTYNGQYWNFVYDYVKNEFESDDLDEANAGGRELGGILYQPHPAATGSSTTEYRFYFDQSYTNNGFTYAYTSVFNSSSALEVKDGDICIGKGASAGQKYFKVESVDKYDNNGKTIVTNNPLPSFKDVYLSGYYSVKIQFIIKKYDVNLITTSESKDAEGSNLKYITAIINKKELQCSESEYKSSGTRGFSQMEGGATSNSYIYDGITHGWVYTISGILPGESLNASASGVDQTISYDVHGEANKFYVPGKNKAGVGSYSYTKVLIGDKGNYLASNYTTNNTEESKKPKSKDSDPTSREFDVNGGTGRSWSISPRTITLTITWSNPKPTKTGGVYKYNQYNGSQQGITQVKIDNYVVSNPMVIGMMESNEEDGTQTPYSSSYATAYTMTYTTSSWDNNHYAKYVNTWHLYISMVKSSISNYTISVASGSLLEGTEIDKNVQTNIEWTIGQRELTILWKYNDETTDNKHDGTGEWKTQYQYNGRNLGVVHFTISGFLTSTVDDDEFATANVITITPSYAEYTSSTSNSKGADRLFNVSATKAQDEKYKIKITINNSNYKLTGDGPWEKEWEIIVRILTITATYTENESYGATYTYNRNHQGVTSIAIGNMPAVYVGNPYKFEYKQFNNPNTLSNVTGSVNANSNPYQIVLTTNEGYKWSTDSHTGTNLSNSNKTATASWTINKRVITVGKVKWTDNTQLGINDRSSSNKFTYNASQQGVVTFATSTSSTVADGTISNILATTDVTYSGTITSKDKTTSALTYTVSLADTTNFSLSYVTSTGTTANKTSVEYKYFINPRELELKFYDVSDQQIYPNASTNAYHYYYKAANQGLKSIVVDKVQGTDNITNVVGFEADVNTRIPSYNNTTKKFVISNLTFDYLGNNKTAYVKVKSNNSNYTVPDSNSVYWVIDQIPIVFTIDNASYYYDGTEHTITNWEAVFGTAYSSSSPYATISTNKSQSNNQKIVITYGSTPEYLIVSNLPKRTVVGDSNSTTASIIADTSTNINNYLITNDNGSKGLSIKARPLTISWGAGESGNLVYNADKRTLKTVTISEIVHGEAPLIISIEGTTGTFVKTSTTTSDTSLNSTSSIISNSIKVDAVTYTFYATNANTYNMAVALNLGKDNNGPGKNYSLPSSGKTSTRIIDPKEVTFNSWETWSENSTKRDDSYFQYDGVKYTRKPVPTGVISGDTLSITCSSVVTTNTYSVASIDNATNGYAKFVGEYTYTVTDLGNTNYKFTGSPETKLTIARRELIYTIKNSRTSTEIYKTSIDSAMPTGVTNPTNYFNYGNVLTETYDKNNHGVTIVASNLVSGDTISFTSLLDGVAQTGTLGETTYTVTMQATSAKSGNSYSFDTIIGGTNAPNYVACYNNPRAKGVQGTFTISRKALTSALTNNTGTLTYNAANQTLGTFTISGVVSGDFPVEVKLGSTVQDNPTASDTLVYTIVAKGAGKYSATVALTTAGNVNYTLSGDKGFTDREINKAPLNVKANDKTITYGDAPTNAGVTYTGFVGSPIETASVLGGTLTYVYNYSQYGNVGTYTITPSGYTSDNYSFSYTPGTLTVVQKDIIVSSWTLTTANPSNSTSYTSFTQTYDTYPWTMTATFGGTVNGDVLTATYKNDTTNNEVNVATNAGTYKAIVTGFGGDKAGNYKVAAAAEGSVPEQSWTISKATISVRTESNGCNRTFMGMYIGLYYGVSINGSSSWSSASMDRFITYGLDKIEWNTSLAVTYLDGTEGTTTSAFNAGTYIATITMNQAYLMSNSAKKTTSNYTFSQGERHTGYDYDLKMNALKLTLTWDSNTLTYDGTEQHKEISSISSNVSSGNGYSTNGITINSQSATAASLHLVNTRSDGASYYSDVTINITGAATNAGDHQMSASVTSIKVGAKQNVAKVSNIELINATKDYTIDKRGLTISWTLDSNLEYSKSAKGLTASVSGGLITYDPIAISKTNSEDNITLRNSGAGTISGSNWTYQATAINAKDGYSVTATLNDEDNYEVTSGSLVQTFNITKKKVVLAWQLSCDGANETSPVTYNAKDHYMAATVSNAYSGDTVNVTYADGNSGKNVGNYTATVNGLTGAQSGNYTIENVTNLSSDWEIIKRVISVGKTTWTDNQYASSHDRRSDSVSAKWFTYSGTDQGLSQSFTITTSSTISNFTISNVLDNNNVILSGNLKKTDVGNYSYKIELADKTNFILETHKDNSTVVTGTSHTYIYKIAPLKVQLSWDLDGSSTYTTTYTGTSHTMTATIDNKKGSDDVSPTYTSSGTTVHVATNASTYTATVNGLAGAKAGNYTITDANNLSQSWTINPAKLTVSMKNSDNAYLTGTNGVGSTNYTFDGNGQGAKYVYISGMQNGEVPTGVDTLTGTSATTVSVSLTNVTASGSNTSGTITYTITDTVNKSASQTNNYHLITVTASGNYELDTTATNYLYQFGWYIKPRVITINWKLDSTSIGWSGDTPSNNKVTYNASAHTVYATVGNLAEGAPCTLSVSGDATKTNAGAYTATLAQSGVSNSNYTLTGSDHTTLNWEIQKRILNVTWTSLSDLVYNSAEQGVQLDLTNCLSTEPVTVTSSNATISTGSISGSTWTYTAKGINATGYTVNVELKDKANYSLSTDTNNDGIITKTFNITTRTVTLTWAPTSGSTYTYVYNHSGQGMVATVTNCIAGEDGVSFTSSLTPVKGQSINEGAVTRTYTFKVTDVGTYSATASANSNYTLAFTTGSAAQCSFEITPLAVVISWALTTDKTDDDNEYTTFTQPYNANKWTMTGKVSNRSGDDVTVTYTNSVSSKKVHTAKNADTYTAEVNGLTGTKAGNYTLDGGTNLSQSWKISKVALTITAKAKTIDYGDAAANAGVTYSGFVGGETESVLGGSVSYYYNTQQDNKGTAYAKGANAGSTYYIIPYGRTATNYTISYVAASLTIDRVDLTISSVAYEEGGSATSPTCEYDGYKHGYTIGLYGLVLGEKLKLTFTLEGSPTATRASGNEFDNNTNRSTISAKNKGTYKIKSFSVSNNGDTLASNYHFKDADKVISWTISPVWIKTVTPSLVNTKVYDATTNYTNAKSATFLGRSDNNISALIGNAYTMTAAFSDANVNTPNKTIDYTITLTGDNYTFTDGAVDNDYEASVPATITVRTLTIKMYLGNKKLYKTYDGTSAFAEASYTGGEGTTHDTAKKVKTQRSRTYRAGQGFTITNIPEAETLSLTINCRIAETYESTNTRTGISENGLSTASALVNLDGFVNNTLYDGDTLATLSNFRVSGSSHYKRLVFTVESPSTVNKSNYLLSIDGYTQSNQEYALTTYNTTAMFIYDKADATHNANGIGWSISINKKTVSATYTNTTQSYVNEIDHSIKKKNLDYDLASKAGDWSTMNSRKLYTRSGTEGHYEYALVADDAKSESHFNEYYINTMYEKIGWSNIGVVSTDKSKVGLTITNGWWESIDENNKNTYYEKYTAISGRAGNPKLGAVLTKGTDTVDASINYTLRNQPTLIIGYFVNYNKIDSLGALLLATHYYSNYKTFVVGYDFGWNTVLTSSQYDNGVLAYAKDHATISFKVNATTSINATYNIVYDYIGNIDAFDDETDYYTGVFTLVDKTLTDFDITKWYYTLNPDGSYTYVAGMTEFSNGVDYYTAVFTKVEGVDEPVTDTKYYVQENDWSSWFDWYQRLYKNYADVEVELIQYTYDAASVDDPDNIFTDSSLNGYWGIYEEQEETWSDAATTMKYEEFVVSANIDGVYTQEDIDLLNAQFGEGKWGVGQTALPNFVAGSAGDKCTAIGSVFLGTFSGTFNGDGYVINNINIVKYNSAAYVASTTVTARINVGFFDTLGTEAKVSGLHLRNTSISLTDDYSTTRSNNVNVGGIAGFAQNNTAVSSVSFHGSINAIVNGARLNLGGIIGYYKDAIPTTSTLNNVCVLDNAIVAGSISTIVQNGTNDTSETKQYVTASSIGGVVGFMAFSKHREAYINDVVSVATVNAVLMHSRGHSNNYGALIGQGSNISYYATRGESYYLNEGFTRYAAIITRETKAATSSVTYYGSDIASNSLMRSLNGSVVSTPSGYSGANLANGNTLSIYKYRYYDSTNNYFYVANDLGSSTTVYKFSYDGTTFTSDYTETTVSAVGSSNFVNYSLSYSDLRTKNINLLKVYSSGKRDTMSLNNIIDAYVLMNGTILNGSMYVVNVGNSWVVGNSAGTNSDRFIISSVQNVSLLRMFKFASFNIANDVLLPITADDELYFGAFVGNISITSGSTIGLRQDNQTKYVYTKNSGSTENKTIYRMMFGREYCVIDGIGGKNFTGGIIEIYGVSIVEAANNEEE